MWMRTENELFNTDTGVNIWIYINTPENSFIQMAKMDKTFNVYRGTEEQARAVFNNICSHLNPANVSPVANGYVEEVEDELRRITDS